jgi:hypothetical protein
LTQVTHFAIIWLGERSTAQRVGFFRVTAYAAPAGTLTENIGSSPRAEGLRRFTFLPVYPPEAWHAMLPASKSPVAVGRIQ